MSRSMTRNIDRPNITPYAIDLIDNHLNPNWDIAWYEVLAARAMLEALAQDYHLPETVLEPIRACLIAAQARYAG